MAIIHVSPIANDNSLGRHCQSKIDVSEVKISTVIIYTKSMISINTSIITNDYIQLQPIISIHSIYPIINTIIPLNRIYIGIIQSIIAFIALKSPTPPPYIGSKSLHIGFQRATYCRLVDFLENRPYQRLFPSGFPLVRNSLPNYYYHLLIHPVF